MEITAVPVLSFENIIAVRRKYQTHNSRISSFDELVDDWDDFLDELEAEDDVVYGELMKTKPSMKQDAWIMKKASEEELEGRKKRIGARKYGAEPEYKDYDHYDVIDYAFVFKHQWPTLSKYIYGAYPCSKPNTVHISSLKLTTTNCDDDDEEYSLQVYGWVHMYTDDGSRYQELFNRKRDESLIFTKESRDLPLTGPICPPKCYGLNVEIRGTLILKGTTEEDDEYLIISHSQGSGDVGFQSDQEDDSEGSGDVGSQSEEDDYQGSGDVGSQSEEDDYQGSGDVGSQSEEGDKGLKHTTYSLVMKRGIVLRSIVAIISIKVVGNPCDWFVTASTSRLPDMEIVLLDSGRGNVHVGDGGIVPLLRSTICVESPEGELTVCVRDGSAESNSVVFPAGCPGYKDSKTCQGCSSWTVEVDWFDYESVFDDYASSW